MESGNPSAACQISAYWLPPLGVSDITHVWAAAFLQAFAARRADPLVMLTTLWSAPVSTSPPPFTAQRMARGRRPVQFC